MIEYIYLKGVTKNADLLKNKIARLVLIVKKC